jgi:hypothetical protein
VARLDLSVVAVRNPSILKILATDPTDGRFRGVPMTLVDRIGNRFRTEKKTIHEASARPRLLYNDIYFTAISFCTNQ